MKKSDDKASITRRNFIAGAAAAVAASKVVTSSNAQAASANTPFKLKYAPSLGQFKEHAGSDPLDRLQFMSDQGFNAVFDNGLARKSAAEQEALARKTDSLGFTWGPFIAYAEFAKPTFVTSDREVRDMLKEKMDQAIETSKRTSAKWGLIVPGRYHEKLHWDYQTVNVVENLRYCAELCAPSGLVLVIEPLNTHRNHPGVFLQRIPQAYLICRAVNSPNVKIINDLYHQQITEGNLIPNIDMAWDEIAAFHVGDNPGRKEPGTGEINYTNIFKHIHAKGYEGTLCLEHGTSKKGIEGEKALIEAYRKCDNFEPAKS
jgi:hydroxypyruvate isomerase